MPAVFTLSEILEMPRDLPRETLDSLAGDAASYAGDGASLSMWGASPPGDDLISQGDAASPARDAGVSSGRCHSISKISDM